MERLKCKVAPLATEKATRLQLTKNYLNLTVSEFIPDSKYTVGQHLYFTSKREIKEGDWIYIAGKIAKASVQNCRNQAFPKIEATTDPSLGLPLIPQSFVEKYVALQGKIDEVEIEMYVFDYTVNGVQKTDVKTRPDNTVIVHKVKDTWTRDERNADLIKLAKECILYPHFFRYERGIFDVEKTQKWIEENL